MYGVAHTGILNENYIKMLYVCFYMVGGTIIVGII